MSNLIGDTSNLHTTRIPFHAVHELVGIFGSGHFPLLDCNGIKHLVSARATVRIVSDQLSCQVIGPAAADKAVTVHVAVIPSTAPAWPTTAAHLLTIGGSAFTQHSLYVGASATPLAFTQEVAHQIKPRPLVGSPPEVVYYFSVTGGVATTVSYLRISGILEVDGVGYVQPW